MSDSTPSAPARSSRRSSKPSSKRTAAPALGTLDGSSAHVDTVRPGRRGLVVGVAALIGAGLLYAVFSGEDPSSPVTPLATVAPAEPEPSSAPEERADAPPDHPEPAPSATAEVTAEPTTTATSEPAPRPRPVAHVAKPPPTVAPKATAEPAAKSGKPDYCSHPTLAFERTPDGMLRYRKECQ